MANLILNLIIQIRSNNYIIWLPKPALVCFFPFLACRCSNDTHRRILAFLALWCALEARWATRVASTTRLVVPGLNLRPHEPRLVLVVAVLWCGFGAVCSWWWAPVVFLAPWRALAPQGGHLSSSKSKHSIRIDLRPQMWQSTSMTVCFGLALAVACVLLVVAISAVSWLFWRSCGHERSAGWPSE